MRLGNQFELFFGPVSFQTFLIDVFSLKQQLLTCQVTLQMHKWHKQTQTTNENTILSRKHPYSVGAW